MNQLAVFTDTVVDDDVVIHEEEVFAPNSRTGQLHVAHDEPLILQPGCVLLRPTPKTLLDSARRPIRIGTPLQEATCLYATRDTALPLTVRYAARRR